MAGVKHKRKGARIEREIVTLLEEINIVAERVPLSGAAHYRGGGHDVDVYPFGVDEEAWVFEVKGRQKGNGFRLLDRWLGANDGLFLKRDRRKPLVVLPWHSLAALLVAAGKAWQRGLSKEQRDAIYGRRADRAVVDDTGGHDAETQTKTPVLPKVSEVSLADGDAPHQTVRMAARKKRT